MFDQNDRKGTSQNRSLESGVSAYKTLELRLQFLLLGQRICRPLTHGARV